MNGRQFRVLAALTVVSGFFGGAVSNLLLQGGPAQAQAGGAVQEVVKAKRFEVVDGAGGARAIPGGLADGSPWGPELICGLERALQTLSQFPVPQH